jgi:predicted metal-dependent phosphoesterase TrpH
MSSLDNLYNQVRKIVEEVGPAQASEPEMGDFDLSSYTAEEQERFKRFLAQIETRCPDFHAKRPFEELTNAELDEFEHWALLDDAHRRGDQAAAEMYRRKLARSATSDEELVQRFLALDESSIPTHEEGARQVKQGHVRYTLSRINYRHARTSVAGLRADGLRCGDREELWMWLEAYANG